MKKLGTTTITDVVTKTGKKMIAAFREDGTRILMDVTDRAIPDGQTSYMFDNKLIVTVHWNGFTDEDVAQTLHSEILFRMGMMKSGLCMFVKFGNYPWGDVLNLPGIMGSFNDPNKVFTDLVFIFVDSDNGSVIGIREIPLNGEISNYIAAGNAQSYIFFNESGFKKSSYKLVSELHDDWCKAAAEDLKIARNIDFEAMKNAPGIYGIDVDKDDFAKFYRY